MTGRTFSNNFQEALGRRTSIFYTEMAKVPPLPWSGAPARPAHRPAAVPNLLSERKHKILRIVCLTYLNISLFLEAISLFALIVIGPRVLAEQYLRQTDQHADEEAVDVVAIWLTIGASKIDTLAYM